MYSDIAPIPKRLATLRIDRAARPSASAISTPAATTSDRLVRGLGPRTGDCCVGAQSSSTTRRPSGVPWLGIGPILGRHLSIRAWLVLSGWLGHACILALKIVSGT